MSRISINLPKTTTPDKLPTIFISFKENLYPCFTPFTLKSGATTDPKDCLFLNSEIPSTPIDPLKIFYSPISSFVQEIQQLFQIPHDITLSIPDLQLNLYPHSVYLNSISISELYELYSLLYSPSSLEFPPLKIVVTPTDSCFLQQYSSIYSKVSKILSKSPSNPYYDQGTIDKPILLDDDDESITPQPLQPIDPPKTSHEDSDSDFDSLEIQSDIDFTKSVDIIHNINDTFPTEIDETNNSHNYSRLTVEFSDSEASVNQYTSKDEIEIQSTIQIEVLENNDLIQVEPQIYPTIEEPESPFLSRKRLSSLENNLDSSPKKPKFQEL